MSKGSQRRPSRISDEEYSLRWDLAFGKITEKEFTEKLNDLNLQKYSGDGEVSD